MASNMHKAQTLTNKALRVFEDSHGKVTKANTYLEAEIKADEAKIKDLEAQIKKIIAEQDVKKAQLAENMELIAHLDNFITGK